MESQVSLENQADLLFNMVEQVTQKIGYSKTFNLLKSFISNSDISYKTPSKTRFQIDFIKGVSIELFSLNEECFLTSKAREYKEARQICIHVLKKHSSLSDSFIGEFFGFTKRQIKYRRNEVAKMLSVRRLYPEFGKNYDLIENRFIEFKAKLN